MNRILKSWIPVLVWMMVIFLFSAQPASASSKMSGSLMTLLVSIIDVTPIPQILGEELLHTLIRKTAHLTVYLVLGILVLRALVSQGIPKSKSVWLALSICVVYAGTDEFHQLFVPGRSGQISDVLIDSSGALLGIILSRVLNKWRP